MAQVQPSLMVMRSPPLQLVEDAPHPSICRSHRLFCDGARTGADIAMFAGLVSLRGAGAF